jgi:nucleoid-associated protein YgaU
MANGASYTVQPGDTLSGIAQQQLGDATRWPEIFVLNRDVVSDPDKIVPGQVLVLPSGPPMHPPPRLYTVRRGDSLSRIAQAELNDASRWPEIFDLNRQVITDPDRIFPGQILVLPT